MDHEVQDAWKAWRATIHHVDDVVELLVRGRPVDRTELRESEEAEFLARRRYYRLLQERHGFPAPVGVSAVTGR